MKIPIVDKSGKETGKIQVPTQFNETYRPDLIKKAALAILANNRQAYGASPEAGKRHSAFLSKRRRKYRGTYGIGQSRTPRKVLNRNGTRFFYVGAVAPQTVGGRRAHPPKSTKIWTQKINTKENRKAIRSALSAAFNVEIVKEKGHIIPSNYPFVLAEEFKAVKKTSDLKDVLVKLGLEDELKRAQVRKVRAGKGKTRGRKYKTKVSILFVVTEPCDLAYAALNIPGCDIVLVQNLNAYLLAPGARAGRLTLFTEDAIKQLEEKQMFTKNYKGPAMPLLVEENE